MIRVDDNDLIMPRPAAQEVIENGNLK
jgi:hypothetical protein